MARSVFYSFDFKRDAQRVSQVKNMGVIAGQPLLSSNQWEEVEKGGAKAIKAWIDKQMKGKSCLVVLIGRSTAGRQWVDYEIEKAWNDGRGVVGVYVHNLKDLNGKQSLKGTNPFSSFTIGQAPNKKKLSTIVKAYDPPYTLSTSVYNHIQKNIAAWVEEAIKIRNAYKQ